VLPRDVRGNLASLNLLVKNGQRLGAEQCRREKLILVRDLDPIGDEVEHGARVDDEPSQETPSNQLLQQRLDSRFGMRVIRVLASVIAGDIVVERDSDRTDRAR
jgi:hypothetical protein